MMNKIFPVLSALALAAVFVLSPLSQTANAQDLAADSNSPRWFCHKKGNGNFGLFCTAICIAESGNYRPTADGVAVKNWDCPNSDVRKRCNAFVCASVEECESIGVSGYESCHENGEAECAIQAQTATGAECIPPLSGGGQ